MIPDEQYNKYGTGYAPIQTDVIWYQSINTKTPIDKSSELKLLLRKHKIKLGINK